MLNLAAEEADRARIRFEYGKGDATVTLRRRGAWTAFRGHSGKEDMFLSTAIDGVLLFSKSDKVVYLV
jgi:hypothetical protein